MEGTLYIKNPGDLRRKDNTLQFKYVGAPIDFVPDAESGVGLFNAEIKFLSFESEEEFNDEKEETEEDKGSKIKKNSKIDIPVEGIREIFFLQEVSINTKVLDFFRKHEIVAHFFNYHEGYSGSFYPAEVHVSGKLLVKQVEALSKREVIGKAIVLGISKNMVFVLSHYKNHKKEGLDDFLTWMKKDLPVALDSAETIPEIMGIEGELWGRFYASFKNFLKEDFVINKRVKHPPDNPTNAMISFGKSILYAKTISCIYKTQLDQRISFLHSPAEKRFSLSLDLSEAFHPFIVFRSIFSLVNNQKIQIEKHFIKDTNYCVLNAEGREIFSKDLEKRLNETFLHKKLNRKISYKTAISMDCYKLMKFILEGEEFTPFNCKKGY